MTCVFLTKKRLYDKHTVKPSDNAIFPVECTEMLVNFLVQVEHAKGQCCRVKLVEGRLAWPLTNYYVITLKPHTTTNATTAARRRACTYNAGDGGGLADADDEVLDDELVLGRVPAVNLEQRAQHPLVLLLLREAVRQAHHLQKHVTSHNTSQHVSASTRTAASP